MVFIMIRKSLVLRFVFSLIVGGVTHNSIPDATFFWIPASAILLALLSPSYRRGDRESKMRCFGIYGFLVGAVTTKIQEDYREGVGTAMLFLFAAMMAFLQESEVKSTL